MWSGPSSFSFIRTISFDISTIFKNFCCRNIFPPNRCNAAAFSLDMSPYCIDADVTLSSKSFSSFKRRARSAGLISSSIFIWPFFDFKLSSSTFLCISALSLKTNSLSFGSCTRAFLLLPSQRDPFSLKPMSINISKIKP